MNIFTYSQLVDWLDGLAHERPLIAPKYVEGVLLYRPVQNSIEIAWGTARPSMSVKEVFFPPTERLMTIEKDGEQVRLTETFSDAKPVVFGLRPCDARGLQVLDAMFIEDTPADPYYARRRENAVLIGLACQEMGPSCFCTSVGGAPNDTVGLDLLLTEVDGGYVLQVLTEKGEALQRGLSLAQFSGSLPEPRTNPPLSPVEKETWLAYFNDEYWERTSERCLSCRICAYVCPTCRCFAVRDEALPEPGRFERIRCWDSCAGENYRRIAGGHRPRAEKGERLRNRFLCKFVYYPEQYSLDATAACTGCGRCVDSCPVNVDITEVLMELGSQP
jgi:sulfhydrogenase subunit beta (sulfur reductase)